VPRPPVKLAGCTIHCVSGDAAFFRAVVVDRIEDRQLRVRLDPGGLEPLRSRANRRQFASGRVEAQRVDLALHRADVDQFRLRGVR
jgi:hypothetical protein